MSLTVFDKELSDLARTKFHRPAPPVSLVSRARLHSLLDSGSALPLTVVSAPAGSGKTTLLGDWLDHCDCASVWLSLDEGDSRLPLFLSYLVAAIRTLFPGACPRTLAMAQAIEAPPAVVLARMLSNEIDALRDHPAFAGQQRFVLVLDDYHLISGQAVNELLMELLRHPPYSMRLVLATRSDPALPLARLRARGHLLEIRRNDLRFDRLETLDYWQQASGRPISEELVDSLLEKTEGWATGLYLALLNLRDSPDPNDFVADLAATHRYVMDYLLEEVLAHQPQLLQEFLLKSSVLDRLCGPLCAALAGVDDPVCDGQAYLEWLEQTNLFVVPLDNHQQWYRFHHLFQQLLRNQLERQASPAQVAELHGRASRWYEENGFVREAIVHALAAGEELAAVQILEAHRQDAMNREHWQHLEDWLSLMPQRLIDQRPELLMLEAWVAMRQWRFAELPPLLARVDTALASASPDQPGLPALRGEAYALRSLLCFYALDHARTLALARRALAALPPTHASSRGMAWMYVAGGLLDAGEVGDARKALHEALLEDWERQNTFPSRVWIALGILNWVDGDMATLRQTASLFVARSEEYAMAESVGWARYLRGCAAYQSNDLAAAEQDFAFVAGQRYVMHGFPFTQAVFGLASICLARGELDQARTLVESLASFGMETGNSRVQADARAFLAWVAVRSGRLAAARHALEAADLAAAQTPMTTFHIAELSWVRVGLALGTPAGLNKAREWLDRLRAYLDSREYLRLQIEALALHALLYRARGREGEALATLGQAVELAAPRGLLRIFVDSGPEMALLLQRLDRRADDEGFVQRVLQAFSSANPESSQAARRQPSPAIHPLLVEPLTYREVEVLALLAQRLSAKEIARQLVISDRTVKRHTANIYQKLAVHNRQQAVETAVALGILASRRSGFA